MNVTPFFSAGPVILMHLVLAIGALVLGISIAVQRKGGALHKWSGRIWSGLMLATAATSIDIKSLFPGHFSPIHLLSLVTLCTIPLGLIAIRSGNVTRHKYIMLSNFAGLCIAGLFTLIPGRLLGQVLFGW